jgi:hypothetical protein
VVSDRQVDKVLEFSIGNRERGSTLDLFAFHPDGSLVRNLTEEELDTLFLEGVETIPLQAGDADQDLDFDQLDLVQVQVAAKYLTGQEATWGEGDWNAAPGGSPGNPPKGDGLFNQLDIVAAQQAGLYLTGPYAAAGADRLTRQPLASAVASVPEPSCVGLLAVAVLTLLALPRGIAVRGRT